MSLEIRLPRWNWIHMCCDISRYFRNIFLVQVNWKYIRGKYFFDFKEIIFRPKYQRFCLCLINCQEQSVRTFENSMTGKRQWDCRNHVEGVDRTHVAIVCSCCDDIGSTHGYIPGGARAQIINHDTCVSPPLYVRRQGGVRRIYVFWFSIHEFLGMDTSWWLGSLLMVKWTCTCGATNFRLFLVWENTWHMCHEQVARTLGRVREDSQVTHMDTCRNWWYMSSLLWST